MGSRILQFLRGSPFCEFITSIGNYFQIFSLVLRLKIACRDCIGKISNILTNRGKFITIIIIFFATLVTVVYFKVYFARNIRNKYLVTSTYINIFQDI